MAATPVLIQINVTLPDRIQDPAVVAAIRDQLVAAATSATGELAEAGLDAVEIDTYTHM